MTEDQLLDVVIEAAQIFGWLAAHFRPALTARGWRTPVQGDGAGFPDLLLVHPVMRRVLYVELKSERGQLRPDQVRWIASLKDAGERVLVWRPADWTSGAIETELRRAA